jgi:hypothetical protein
MVLALAAAVLGAAGAGWETNTDRTTLPCAAADESPDIFSTSAALTSTT